MEEDKKKKKKVFAFLFYHFKNMVTMGVVFFVLVFGLAGAAIYNSYKFDRAKSKDLIAKTRIAKLENLKKDLTENIDDIKKIGGGVDGKNLSSSKITKLNQSNKSEKRIAKRTEVPFYDSGADSDPGSVGEGFDPTYDLNRGRPILNYTPPVPVVRYNEDSEADNSDTEGEISQATLANIPAINNLPTNNTTTDGNTDTKNNDTNDGGNTGTTGGVVLPTSPEITDPGDTNTNGTFSLNWTASNSTAGIKEYELQESTSSGFSIIKSANIIVGLQFDFKLHDNGVYYYRVRAVDVNGLSGPWSNTVDIIVDHPAVPTTPILNDVTKNSVDQSTNFTKEADFRVCWLASTSAAGLKFYHLQEATDSAFTANTKVYDVNPSELTYQFTLKQPNGTYYYRVSAEDINGFTSKWSNVLNININCPPPTPPEAPVIIDPGNPNLTGTYSIAWNAPLAGGGISGYEYQESTSSDFDPTKTRGFSYASDILSVNMSGKDDGTYYYRVRAIDKNGFKGNWGTFSLIVARPFIANGPAMNDIVKNNIVDGYAREADYLVSWSAANYSEGIKTYHLMESTDENFNPANSFIMDIPSTQLSYQATLQYPSGTYYYKVRAVGVDGGLSNWSEVKNITVNLIEPIPPSDPEVTDLGGTNATGNYLLQWTASESGIGIYRYKIKEVQRTGVSPNIKTVYNYYEVTDNSYQFSQKANATYYYYVMATDKYGFESAYSTPSVKLIVNHPAAPSVPTLNNIVRNNVVNGYTREADYLVSWVAPASVPGGLKAYQLQEAADSAFSVNLNMITLTSDKLSYQVNLKQPNGTYYYRLRAEDNNGFTSDWTSVKSVTINCPSPTPPSPPILTAPVTSETGIFDLSWSSPSIGAEIATYELEESLLEDFSSVSDSWILVDPKCEINKKENGEYYYRVKAIDKNGFTGTWSNVASTNVAIACHYLNIEAEDMQNLSHSITYSDLTAWGQASINSGAEGTTSVYDFYAPIDGIYTVFVRMGQSSDASDAVEVKFNNTLSLLMGNATGEDSQWSWVNYLDGDKNNIIETKLSQGKNTFSIISLEPGVKIDSIIITNDSGFTPSDTPYGVSVPDWQNVIPDGFGDKYNHEAKIAEYNGSLYISTSNSKYTPGIFKSSDGLNFQKVFDFKVLKTDWSDSPNSYTWSGTGMYRTLDLKYLDIGDKSGLYALTDTGSIAYMNKVDDDKTTSVPIGYFYRYDNSQGIYFNPRGYWTNQMVSFKNKDNESFVYAGFYNDWNLDFTMKRTLDPMEVGTMPVIPTNHVVFPANGGAYPSFELPWKKVSTNSFGPDPENSPRSYGIMNVTAISVFKGYLYVGTDSCDYFSRINRGGQIWRTDGKTLDANGLLVWEKVVSDGFQSIIINKVSSISRLSVFGGYLYAGVTKSFGYNYIMRSKDGLVWELAYQGMSDEPYFGDIVSYMGKLYLSTYNRGKVYSSSDGKIWTAVTNKYMNNNTANSLIGDICFYRGYIYVDTRNSTTGTNIFRAKVVK